MGGAIGEVEDIGEAHQAELHAQVQMMAMEGHGMDLYQVLVAWQWDGELGPTRLDGDELPHAELLGGKIREVRQVLDRLLENRANSRHVSP